MGERGGRAAGECLELGEKIAVLAPRVALLAMGDGPGRRARGAPGARDPAADRYDDQVAAAPFEVSYVVVTWRRAH